MTDKERILMSIIRELSMSQTLAPAVRMRGYDRENWLDTDGREFVHFANYIQDGDLKVGDLVLCQTSGRSESHDFNIGFIHEYVGYGDCVIREIGTNRLCRIGNERFIPIKGLKDYQLWENDKHEFSVKIHRAFSKGGSDWYRYGGLEFEGDEAVIWIREKWGGLMNPSKPFEVRIKWNKKTTIKAILNAMRDAGYGTRKFDPIEKVPEVGE